MHKIIKQVYSLLELKIPYEIIFKPKIHKAAAYYRGIYRKGKLKTHRIVINTDILAIRGNRNIKTLIIHELIHAWQEEKGLTEIHGEYFQEAAKILGEELKAPRVYMKKVDVT